MNQGALDNIDGACNKIVITLLGEVENSPMGASTITFISRFAEFGLGPINTDPTFVSCVARQLATMGRTTSVDMDMALAGLWRTLMTRRPQQLSIICKGQVCGPCDTPRMYPLNRSCLSIECCCLHDSTCTEHRTICVQRRVLFQIYMLFVMFSHR